MRLPLWLLLHFFGVVKLCYSLRSGSMLLRQWIDPLSRRSQSSRSSTYTLFRQKYGRVSMGGLCSAISISDNATITTIPPFESIKITKKNNNTSSSRRKISSSSFVLRKHKVSSAYAKQWNAKFDELVAFHQKYGAVNVPQNPTTQIPEDYQELANFCRNIRCQYRYLQDKETRHLCFLTKERIERLESIGFVWNAQEARWYGRYEELANFSRRFGHCNVPQKWDESPSLASWVSYQRLRYKSLIHRTQDDRDDGAAPTTTPTRRRGGKVGQRPLNQRQVHLLEAIGFKWDPKDEKWWELYHDLKVFWEAEGHCRVPRNNYQASPQLYNWLCSVRKYCRDYVLCVTMDGTADGVHVSGLNADRLKALRDIGFCWLPESEGPLTETPPEDIFEAQ